MFVVRLKKASHISRAEPHERLTSSSFISLIHFNIITPGAYRSPMLFILLAFWDHKFLYSFFCLPLSNSHNSKEGVRTWSKFLQTSSFLGAFAKLRKTTISFVLSVCLSVRMEQLVSQWTVFHEIWYLSFLSRKSVEKMQVFLKSDKNNEYFTWRLFTFTISR